MADWSFCFMASLRSFMICSLSVGMVMKLVKVVGSIDGAGKRGVNGGALAGRAGGIMGG